jgi:hypothetical protein
LPGGCISLGLADFERIKDIRLSQLAVHGVRRLWCQQRKGTSLRG